MNKGISEVMALYLAEGKGEVIVLNKPHAL